MSAWPDVEMWKRCPRLSEALPVELPPHTLDLDRIERVLTTMPPGLARCREGSGDPASTMPALRNTVFSGCLEQRLATECISITMANVHQYDPVIAGVLDSFVDTLPPALIRKRDVRRPTAALFVSSPRARTHYHVDREQNFLMHVRGTKAVHVFKQTNTFATELVKVCSRKRRRIHAQYHPHLERHAQVFHMTPGTTLYIPRLQPHWVANGNEICVSLSLNFFTPSDMRRELLYTANELFRNLMERVPRPTLARRAPAP